MWTYVASSRNHWRWIENSPPAMVGELTGSAAVLRLSRADTDFHLKVKPQLNPPRTSGDGVYCAWEAAKEQRKSDTGKSTQGAR